MRARHDLKSRLAAAAAALGLCLGAPAGANPFDPSAAAPAYEPSAEEWRKAAAEVMTIVRRDFLGAPPADMPAAEGGRATLRHIAQRLDRQAAYIEPEGFHDLRRRRLGLDVRIVTSPNHGVIVTHVAPEGAGARAGLRAGDRLLSVNGMPLDGGSEDEVLASLAPATSGPLELRIERAGATTAVTAVPDARERRSIRKAEVRGIVGYVAVDNLGQDVSEELEVAIAQLLAQRDDLAGLVLDLRGCPGGLLDEVAPTAALFLGPGPVFQERRRDGRKLVRAKRKSRDVLNGRPMIVLIDSQTAAGAELLAGALQERGRARLLGMRSHGQGLVQLVVPLVQGFGGAFKLTTAELQLPSGAVVHRRGLTPDIAVAASLADVGPDPRHHLRQEDLPEDPRLPIATPPAPAPPKAHLPPAGYGGDYQLDQAIAHLSLPSD